VKLVSVTSMSNVLGTVNPIKDLAQIAHRRGALIAVDAAQSVGHSPTDVTELDVDFFAFSAHKMLGPTGLGIFWTRQEILADMPPFLGGGGMITDVSSTGYVPAKGPTRFEAGTPPIAEAAGLGAAVLYLEGSEWTTSTSTSTFSPSDALSRSRPSSTVHSASSAPATPSARPARHQSGRRGVHAHDVAR